MNKKNFLGGLGVFISVFVGQAQAQSSFEIDETTFLNEAKNKMQSSSAYADLLGLSVNMLDVNNDKYISDREFDSFIEGMNLSSYLDETQKKQRREDLLTLFNDADANHDNRLSQEEFAVFWPKAEEWILKDAFRNRDRNKNGVFDMNDLPTLEERETELQKLQESLKKNQEALKNFDADKWVENWVDGRMNLGFEEDFYQMDKNKDGCVDKEEYAIYQLASEVNKSMEEMGVSLTKDDYLSIYDSIKKNNPSCLSKDEYLSFVNEEQDLDDEEYESTKKLLEETDHFLEKHQKTKNEVQDLLDKGDALINDLKQNQAK